MTPEQVLDIARDGIWVILTIAAPVMMIALTVGLIVSLFQALTQIQEMTLVFVPKILAIFLSLLLFMPFMINQLIGFMDRIAGRIATIE